MKILLIEPEKIPHPLEIEPSLKSMQQLVGGSIQAVYPFEEPVALICHEEVKMMGLPLNRALRSPETGEIYDIIAGPFFLCSAPPNSDHFESLTEEQLERYTKRFFSVEYFVGGDSK